MKRIVAMGTENDMIGFGLAGCEVIAETQNPEEGINNLVQREDIALVILSRNFAAKLEESTLKTVRDSTAPVFFVLDEGFSVRFQERIRQVIGTDKI